MVANCERALAVPQDRWSNRDTSSAVQQLGSCYALLKAGCDYWARLDDKLNCWWVTIEFHGFDYFEYGSESGYTSNERFYVPTVEALNRADGGDWY